MIPSSEVLFHYLGSFPLPVKGLKEKINKSGNIKPIYYNFTYNHLYV